MEEEEYPNGFRAFCDGHGDCPEILPFCYRTDEEGGECAPCEECEYLSDGIDGTCGTCGDGYPTIEDNPEYVPECDSHDDCDADAPFCYDGECDSCEACEYCQDGVDGTCGSCGEGYPTVEEGPCEDAADARLFKKRPLYAKATSEKEDDFPISAEEKKKYRKMIQDQLDMEGDTETEEEMKLNMKIVAELAKEDQDKALRMANRFTDRMSDKFGLEDDDIEVKVVDALRKAGRKNREGMTEKEIGQKLIEGLGQLAEDLTDAYVEKRKKKDMDMYE